MSSERKRLTLEDQLHLWDEWAEYSCGLLSTYLRRPDLQDRILDLARERLIVNYESCGDDGFHLSPDILGRDIDEELADAVNYKVMQLSDTGERG